MMSLIIVLLTILPLSIGYRSHVQVHNEGGIMEEMFAWKQMTYDINGELYVENADTPAQIDWHYDAPDSEKFFIQYNNVPIGLEVHRHRVFVTVPRRRHGIPSTLNYVEIGANKSPHLKPYPEAGNNLVSVYRPRVDACNRLWVVDTGLLEVPGERKQEKQPEIVIFDLKTDKEIFRYALKTTDLIDERTPAGLTSIAVDVSPNDCESAFAYITDLATNGIVVFSLRDVTSWRVDHPTFQHDPKALNFTVDGNVINWRDGIFSLTLSDADRDGRKTALFHPLASTKEFSINTQELKSKKNTIQVEEIGDRGPNSQSGSHDFHSRSQVVFFANVAQDAIYCWNKSKPMNSKNYVKVAEDHKKLVYISDLKVSNDYVWVLVNQMPNFVYSTLNTTVYNFYVLK